MKKHRFLRPVGYTIAALLIVLPIFDTIMGALPLRLGTASWRFGFAGLLSRALMTPGLGLFLWAALAGIFEDRKMLRAASVVSIVAALCILIMLVSFSLDALQTRAIVRAEVQRSFDYATATAFGKYLLFLGFFTLFSVGSWRNSRDDRTGASHQASPMVTYPHAGRAQ